MDIQYCEFNLTPRKRANRLSSLETKRGVFLKTVINNENCYAEYFPHASLGDRPVDQFLTEFPQQKEEYDRKIVHLLQKDHEYRSMGAIPFRNHQLWTGSENLKSPIVKFKLMDRKDDLYLGLLAKGIRIRFDGNAFFTKETFHKFLDRIPKQHHSLIDYFEDPIKSLDWSGLPAKTARDFIPATLFDYYIYKPTSEFFPKYSVPVIFSSYLGSDLCTWHTYCEMVTLGSLKLTHGIFAENFYEEQRVIFKGDYYRNFEPDLNVVKDIYRDLDNREWKNLCSI